MMMNIKVRPKIRIRRYKPLLNYQSRYINSLSVKLNENKLGSFFNENSLSRIKFDESQGNKDDIQVKLKNLILKKPVFINSYQDYCSRDLESQEPGSIETYDAFDNFSDILDKNDKLPPTVGSLVEFMNPLTNLTSLGIVLRESQTKFNENYNKLTVLTIDNEIEQVYPINVRFHLYKVLRLDWVTSLNVLENRFNVCDLDRFKLVNVLRNFVGESLNISKYLENQFEVIFSQYSQPYNIVGITLTEIIESLKFNVSILNKIGQSYYQQSILLMSCHLNLVKSPKWLVSSSFNLNKFTNLIMKDCSNDLSAGSNYFVNSIVNAESIEKYLGDLENTENINEYNNFLNHLLRDQLSLNPKSFDELNFYFNIWEGKHFKHLIEILKFAIIYPHSTLIKNLTKLDIFKNETITPSVIFKVLEDLKIYNNQKNQLTDIYLSSNIMGRPSLSQLAISSINELEPNTTKSECLHSNKLTDKFPHLRKTKRYYKDHTIYGLPYLKTINSKEVPSKLGISLEKVNSRKYIINMHIPDIITKVSPNNELFNLINSNSINMKGLINLISGSSVNLFDSRMIDRFRFPNQNLDDGSDWFQVGNVSINKSNLYNKDLTCLTLSFIYNTYESNPFADMNGKIHFSFDSLSTVKIKNISWSDLEDCLNGKSELLPFKLFVRRTTNQKQLNEEEAIMKLNDEDCHNIRFIYSVMNSHFKIRNLNGASVFDPSINIDKGDSSCLFKEVSLNNEGLRNERLITKIASLSLKKQLSFSKSKFFVNEIEKFTGNLTSNYCSQNDIPIYTHYQDVLAKEDENEIIIEDENQEPKDEVLISHNNMFLPVYHANSFYQTLIARDANGFVSLAAYLIGKNYLNKSNIEVFTDENLRNLPLGLNKGYVKMCNILNDYEILLNQFQILSHVQRISINKDNGDYLSSIKKNSYLKRFGYNLHGPLSYEILNQQLNKLASSQMLTEYLGVLHKKFWVFKMLEQRLCKKNVTNTSESNLEGVTYECIITSVGFEIPELDKRIAIGFCKELNIEIDILISIHKDIAIGSIIDCDEVIYLDPVGGECILGESHIL